MSTAAKKSSTEAKEKDLMFDKDLEKDTWDFKSMTDDDPMDFGYGSPAKKDKKKNAFNLLGDLDLDSNPLKKGNETTTKSMDFEEFAGSKNFEKSDSFDFGPDLPTTRQAVSRANTDVKANTSAEKENQNSKGADSMSSIHSKQADSNSSTHSKQATLESKENFEELDSPQRLRMTTSRFHTVRGQPQPANISPLRTSYSKVEENNKPCLSNETAEPSPLHSSETAHTAASRETTPGSHEICRSGTKEDSPRDTEENANNKMISATKSRYEKTEPNISSLSCLDKIKHQQEEMDTDTQAEIQDHTRRTLCVPDAGHSQTTLPEKVPSRSQLGQTAQVQDSSSKLPQDPSDSVPRLSDLKAMQNSDSGQIRSMFFKKIEKPQSHVLQSPTQTEIRPITRERIGSDVNPTINKRHDNEDALPGSQTRTAPTELAKMDSKTANVNTNSSSHEKIIQKDHSGTRIFENVAGLMDHSKLLAKNTTREKSTLQCNTSSSNPDASSLTGKLNKHLSSGGESLQKSKMVSLERPKLGNIISDLRAATQRAIGVNKDKPNSAVQPQVNPSTRSERNTEAPIRKSSEIHHLAPRDKTQVLQYRNVGVNKDQTSSAVQPEVSSSTRTEKNTEAPVRKSSEIHQLAPRDKTHFLQYRNIGGNKVQPISAVQPEVRSSTSNNKNTEAPVKKISEIHHLAPRNKTQILHCPPSLKRKALDEFSSQASRLDDNTTKQLVKESPRTKPHPQITNMANMEIPITEYDENIEKAESYTKELDSICNILKKKHEEAKELLVRAVFYTMAALNLIPENDNKENVSSSEMATVSVKRPQDKDKTKFRLRRKRYTRQPLQDITNLFVSSSPFPSSSLNLPMPSSPSLSVVPKCMKRKSGVALNAATSSTYSCRNFR
ncbi:hypothetical protein Bca4012_087332 [Brassica carinata]